MFQNIENQELLHNAINTIESIVERSLKDSVLQSDILESYFTQHQVA